MSISSDMEVAAFAPHHHQHHHHQHQQQQQPSASAAIVGQSSNGLIAPPTQIATGFFGQPTSCAAEAAATTAYTTQPRHTAAMQFSGAVPATSTSSPSLSPIILSSSSGASSPSAVVDAGPNGDVAFLSFMAAAAAATQPLGFLTTPPLKRKHYHQCPEPTCSNCTINTFADFSHETKRMVERHKTEQQVSREAQVYLETSGRRRGFADIYNYATEYGPQR